MGTKKEEFHQRSNGGDFGKSIFSELGGVIEASFSSTTLQEVEILPSFCELKISLGTVWTDNLVLYLLRDCLD